MRRQQSGLVREGSIGHEGALLAPEPVCQRRDGRGAVLGCRGRGQQKVGCDLGEGAGHKGSLN